MGKQKMRVFSRRMGEEANASENVTAGGNLSRAELITTVRRLGYICVKVHEIVMGRLTTQGQDEMAERFNDLFKPLADMLLHFELDDTLERQNGGEEQDHGV